MKTETERLKLERDQAYIMAKAARREARRFTRIFRKIDAKYRKAAKGLDSEREG